jgi:hypothetical protein
MLNKSGEQLIMLFEKDIELLKFIQILEKFDWRQSMIIN